MSSTNRFVQFFPIPDADHFNVLAPINEYLASLIAGAWSTGSVELSEAALLTAMRAK